jgi:hypothetical protein
VRGKARERQRTETQTTQRQQSAPGTAQPRRCTPLVKQPTCAGWYSLKPTLCTALQASQCMQCNQHAPLPTHNTLSCCSQDGWPVVDVAAQDVRLWCRLDQVSHIRTPAERWWWWWVGGGGEQRSAAQHRASVNRLATSQGCLRRHADQCHNHFQMLLLLLRLCVGR